MSKDNLKPLPYSAIATIQRKHSREYRGGGPENIDIVVDLGRSPIRFPVDLLCYDPRNGRSAGAAGQARTDGPGLKLDLTRYVLIATDVLPTDEQLEAVRVDSDGVVHTGVIRKPVPPPPPKPGPTSDDPGRPLSASVIENIREHWREVVGAAALTPVTRYWRPTMMLGFRVTDGRCVGSLLTQGVAEHEHELVLVRDDVPPTPEELRRVRVCRNRVGDGVWVTYLEPEPVESETIEEVY